MYNEDLDFVLIISYYDSYKKNFNTKDMCRYFKSDWNLQDNDMNFIYKLNICKDETDKMEKNYKRGIEVLHRKMIFDMQRIFKYSGVISRFLILNHLLPRDHI